MSIFEVVRQSVTIRQAALLLAQDFSIDVLPEHHLKFCGGNKTKKSLRHLQKARVPLY